MSIAIQAKFIETLRRTLGGIETQLSFKFFCTQTTQNQDSLCKRIEKLPKGESISSAFRSWMRDGFPVRSADVFHTINRLRKLNFNKRALEVNFPHLFFLFCFLNQIFSASMNIELPLWPCLDKQFILQLTNAYRISAYEWLPIYITRDQILFSYKL
jgi:hypothetical protein